MKRNQESRRSLFLQYDLPTSLTSPEATAITLHRLIHRAPVLTRRVGNRFWPAQR
jgi:hypothetical protein